MLDRKTAFSAGDLTRRASFHRPEEAVDADGQVVQSYPLIFKAWVHVRWLRGGESVMQARLASRSPAIITFRTHEAARAVTSEWRIEIDGKSFEAKEDPREDDSRAYFEMLVERVNDAQGG